MARKPTFGTPDQSKAYVFPDRRRWRGLIGVIGVVAVLVFFGVDLFTGDKTFLTAGPLSKAHAVAGADCAKCHVSWHRPPDRLCIGCHDPLASVTRFSAVAHAERSKSATKQPDHEPRCVFCHTEHLGRSTPVSAVANEACASCHGFRSFGSGHPEFRPLRGAFEVATGIKFSHKKHLRELVGAARGKPLADDEEPEPAEEAKQCGACHKPALDNGDFMTVSFDADCSRCHFDKTGTLGATDPVSADLVATPEQLMAAKPAPAWIQAYKDDFVERRGRIAKRVLHHRDAWILYNIQRMSAEVGATPAAAATGAAAGATDTGAEIDARRAEIQKLDQEIDMLRGQKGAGKLQARLSAIQAQESRLTQEIGELDRRILEATPETAAPSPAIAPGDLKPALDGIDAAIDWIGALPDGWAKAEAKNLRAERKSIGTAGGSVGPGWSEYNLDQRKARLARLLDDLAGAPSSARSELDSLEAPAPAAGGGPPLDKEQRRAAIQEIDATLAVVAGSDAPWAKDEMKNLRAKRDRLATEGGASGGWSTTEIAGRKEDAAAGIEDLSRASGAAQAIASMRRELDTVTASPGKGAPPIASLRPEREQKARALAGLKRQAAAIQASLSSGTVDEGRIAGLQDRKRQVEGEIEALEQLRSQPAPAARGGEDADEIRKAAARLTKPCLKCHVEKGLGLSPTAPARRVLSMSSFSHAPHVKVALCLDCHSSVLASEKSTKVHFAGVAKCRECHKWSRTEATCRTCHRYHPAPAAAETAGLAGPPVAEVNE